MTGRADDNPPVRRYLVVSLLAVAVLLAITLLVRPFILSLAGARDDANYPLSSIADADLGPRLVEIVLNDSHGLGGEVVRGERVGYSVVLSPRPGGAGYWVVGAWSPTGNCPLAIDQDRLRDCNGATWTFEGLPFETGEPSLTAFPVAVRNGAVLADFTAPMDPAAS